MIKNFSLLFLLLTLLVNSTKTLADDSAGYSRSDIERISQRIFAPFLNRSGHCQMGSHKLQLAKNLSLTLQNEGIDQTSTIDDRARLPVKIILEDRFYSTQEYDNIVSKLQEYRLALINFVFFAQENKLGVSVKGNVFHNGKSLELSRLAADYIADPTGAQNMYRDRIIFVVPHYDRIVLNFTDNNLGDPNQSYFTNMMNISRRSATLKNWVEDQNIQPQFSKRYSLDDFIGFYYDPNFLTDMPFIGEHEIAQDVFYIDGAIHHDRLEAEIALKAVAIEWFRFSSVTSKAVTVGATLGLVVLGAYYISLSATGRSPYELIFAASL